MVKPVQTFVLWRQLVTWLRSLLVQLAKGKVNWKDVFTELTNILNKGSVLIDDGKPAPTVPNTSNYDLIGPLDPVKPRGRFFRRLFNWRKNHKLPIKEEKP